MPEAESFEDRIARWEALRPEVWEVEQCPGRTYQGSFREHDINLYSQALDLFFEDTSVEDFMAQCMMWRRRMHAQLEQQAQFEQQEQ